MVDFPPGAESLAGYVVAQGRPRAIDDLRVDSSFLPTSRREHEVSVMAHPLMYANRVAGWRELSQCVRHQSGI